MKKKTAPWMGIVAFVICILWQIAASFFLPPDIGLWGTAILEVGILAIALIGAWLSRVPFREIFPIRKPRWNHLLGVVVMYFAGTYLTSVITFLTGVIFPESMMQTASHLSETMNTLSAPLAFLIVAVMPPICEEALHRGFIMNSFSRMKSTAWMLILMGIFFGIFHLDPFRFLITGVLGVLLAYLMYETENLLIPALFHMVNNAFSLISSLGNTTFTADITAADVATVFSPFLLGIALCVYGTLAPFLLYGGARLITFRGARSSEKPFPHKKFLIIAGIVSGCCLISGLILIAANFGDFLSGLNLDLLAF